MTEPVRFMNLGHAPGEPIFQTGYPGDAGIDLFTCLDRSVKVNPGEFRDIPLGVAVQLPKGTWGLLTGRSSTSRRHGLDVTNGIIDGGYRGALFVGVRNNTDTFTVVHPRQRLCQLIVLPVHLPAPLHVQQIDLDSDRGDNGFGSTGH